MPEETREEAIKRLTESASSLEARSERQMAHEAAGQKAAGQAWRILADLFGGVLVGLAIGFIVDRVFDTAPAGLIGGVLLGFAVSVWMARLTAKRLMAEAKSAGEPPQAVAVREDDEGA